MTDQPRSTAHRARLLLLSVASLGVLLFGIVAMHAQMAVTDAPAGGGTMTVATMAVHPGHAPTVDAVGASSDVMQHGMGGMSAMDCLLLGMMCLFGAVAVLLILMLTGRLRSLLRRLLATRSLAAAGRLWPPGPPSLLVLSICRT